MSEESKTNGEVVPNIKDYQELANKVNQVCPKCGYCPCCGRPRDNFNYPIYPNYPWPNYPNTPCGSFQIIKGQPILGLLNDHIR